MRWWRAGVAVGALLLVVVAASGTSPITWVDRRGKPQESQLPPSIVTPTDIDLPDVFAIPFSLFLLGALGVVLIGLTGIVMVLEVPRWRRRRKGTRGIEVEEGEILPRTPIERVRKALQEFTNHPQRPPRDAVIAAWLALEEAAPRMPHQTPTEFTDDLHVDASVLKDLYQRARFGNQKVTEQDVETAKQELGRIVRELA